MLVDCENNQQINVPDFQCVIMPATDVLGRARTSAWSVPPGMERWPDGARYHVSGNSYFVL